MILNKLIAIGDSHVDMYAPFCRATCRVPGATAYGLSNCSSKTRSRDAFLGFLSGLKSYIPIVCLGEVDCNSLVWYKQVGHTGFVNTSVRHLMRFLSEVNTRFIVSSVIPPAVNDYQQTAVRPHVIASKEERTRVVKVYNERLKNKSTLHGHVFLDITTNLLGTDGLLDMSYAKSQNKTHLDVRKVRPIIEEKLLEAESIYSNL